MTNILFATRAQSITMFASPHTKDDTTFEDLAAKAGLPFQSIYGHIPRNADFEVLPERLRI